MRSGSQNKSTNVPGLVVGYGFGLDVMADVLALSKQSEILDVTNRAKAELALFPPEVFVRFRVSGRSVRFCTLSGAFLTSVEVPIERRAVDTSSACLINSYCGVTTLIFSSKMWIARIGYRRQASPSSASMTVKKKTVGRSLDLAGNAEGTMTRYWALARGGAWRNPKPTGGPYVCEQCRLDACGGNDRTLTLQAVTTIELAAADVCADCGARLLEEREVKERA